MRLEEENALLKEQMNEMDQDIKNYLELLERYEKALKEIAKETGTPYADIAIIALNS